MTRALALAALAFCLSAPVHGAETTVAPTTTSTLSFSLPEARQIALQSAAQGRPDVALALTQQLLDRDPQDGDAHLARGTAFLAVKDWGAAYKGGRLAARHARSKPQKFQAARVAALAAMGGNKDLLTQFWLRRAGDLAPTEVDRKKIEQQFRYVQSQTPWAFRLDAAVTPSSNVNGGSETAYSIIDGVPIVGILSASAQALSGVVAQGSVRGSYRLSESETQRTRITGGLFAKEVVLSDEAKAAAPTFDAGTLGVMSLDLGLSHTAALDDTGTILSLSGTLRGYWQGDALAYTAALARTSLQYRLTPQLLASGGLTYERRFYDGGGVGAVGSASLGLTYAFQNGNRLSGRVFGTLTDTPSVTFDSDSVAGRLTYSFSEPVWTMLLSASLGYTETHYPDYSFGIVPVPGGRGDEAVFLDLNATLTGVEFAGFSPSVRLRRTETRSNVSRFDTAEWAVSMGIQSNF